MDNNLGQGKRGATDDGCVMAEKEQQLQGLLKALQHPIRRKLLKMTIEQGELTVPNSARQLGHLRGNLRYHIGILEDAGALWLVDRKTVRGSMTNVWRTTAIVEDTRWVREALAGRCGLS